MPFRIGLTGDAVEQTFARLIHEPWGKIGTGWIPAIDVMETEQEVLISVEAPGVPVETVTVSLDGSILTISGERRTTELMTSGRAISLERTWGVSAADPAGCPVDLTRMELRARRRAASPTPVVG
jgi:HSP20 family molecular chaperone IbpA